MRQRLHDRNDIHLQLARDAQSDDANIRLFVFDRQSHIRSFLAHDSRQQVNCPRADARIRIIPKLQKLRLGLCAHVMKRQPAEISPIHIR